LSKVAYTIKETAEVASVDKSTVVLAIQEGRLIARAINGTAIVLRTDIETWLGSLPIYRVMG